MRLILQVRVLCAVALCVLLCGCGNSFKSTADCEFSLVSWNVQTFFDAVTEGCEYAEFKKGGNWNEEKYIERLKRLCSVIKELDADVYAFQEVENEAVLHDICNMLAGASWDFSKSWNYSCFSKPEGSAIGCAVLSRFEISEMTVHALDVRSQKQKQPSMRYLMQVKLNLGAAGRLISKEKLNSVGEFNPAEELNSAGEINSAEGEFILMVNHWKSKSGGAEKTEIWRDWQESVLASRLIELELNGGGRLPVIACGDFNRDAREFLYCSALNSGCLKNVVLKAAGLGRKNCIAVYSPWFTEDGSLSFETGSYYYKDSWEYIDQIFCNDRVCIDSFEPYAKSPLLTTGGIPFSYKIYTGKGYADHLPLKCKVKIKNKQQK